MNKIGLICVTVLLSCSARAQSLLFDTTGYTNNTFTAFSATDGFIYADDVSVAAGADITTIQVDFVNSGANTTADLTFRFYNPDGGGGAPGTQIGSDISLNNVNFIVDPGTFNSSIVAAVPNITVPTDFFWSVELNNISLAGMFDIFGIRRAEASPVSPAGASTDSGFFFVDEGGGAGFELIDDNGGASPRVFGAQLLAVPEAATFSLSVLGLLVIAGIRRFIQRDR